MNIHQFKQLDRSPGSMRERFDRDLMQFHTWIIAWYTKAMKKRVVAVDFDGVIHAYSKGWQDGAIYDVPVEGAQERLKLLVDWGYEVVIFTTRANPTINEDATLEIHKVTLWLADNGMYEGTHFHEITALKPVAGVYIDDRALRFTNWTDVIKYFQ